MLRTKRLNALASGYSQIAIVFPIVVAAPRYFSGQLELGGLTQTADAFGQVQSALSWFVNAYASLAQWTAIVERLTTFHRAIVVARTASRRGLVLDTSDKDEVRLADLTLELPNGQKLLDGTNLRFRTGESVVVTGRTGSGKSTLFRAIAGIWPFAQGTVHGPRERCLFLPQRPYIPLGTLRDVITYPKAAEEYSDAEVKQVLQDAGLPGLVDQLDLDRNWPQVLSGGEQQRVALARALLAKPDWLFLDEATASLDPVSEAHLYRIIKERLPRATIVSIAHRHSVAEFHDRKLVLRREVDRPGRLFSETVGAVAAD